MPEFKIGGSSRECLTVTISARTRPQDTDYWDGNWLNAEAEVNVGGFRGRVRGSLRAEEFVDFHGQVVALLQAPEGRATFSTMEGWLKLDILGDGKGHIELEGELRDAPGVGNRLTFHLSFDQTFLPGLVAGLAAVVKTFPVRGARDA